MYRMSRCVLIIYGWALPMCYCCYLLLLVAQRDLCEPQGLDLLGRLFVFQGCHRSVWSPVEFSIHTHKHTQRTCSNGGLKKPSPRDLQESWFNGGSLFQILVY